jgi:hypothetical protein
MGPRATWLRLLVVAESSLIVALLAGILKSFDGDSIPSCIGYGAAAFAATALLFFAAWQFMKEPPQSPPPLPEPPQPEPRT